MTSPVRWRRSTATWRGEWVAWRYQPDQGEVERFASFAELFRFCRDEGDVVTS